MKYYLMQGNIENYISYGPKENSAWDFFLDGFETESYIAPCWEALEVELINEHLTINHQDADCADIFSLNATPIFLFTIKAKEIIGDNFELFGEFLPVNCSDKELFIYHATNVIDVLDEEKSEVERFPSGRIMHIVKYELQGDKLKGMDIFRIKGDKWKVFVSGKIRSQIISSGLKGFEFEWICDVS